MRRKFSGMIILPICASVFAADPPVGSNIRNQAKLLMQQGNFSEACREYARLQTSGYYGDVMYYADCLEKIHEYQKAIDLWESIIIDPLGKVPESQKQKASRRRRIAFELRVKQKASEENDRRLLDFEAQLKALAKQREKDSTEKVRLEFIKDSVEKAQSAIEKIDKKKLAGKDSAIEALTATVKFLKDSLAAKLRSDSATEQQSKAERDRLKEKISSLSGNEASGPGK
jgi:hypothetical protein